MPSMRSILVIALVSAAASCAQDVQEKKLAKLEGHAVNSVTSEPVRKVKLSLTAPGGGGSEPRTASAESDAEGHFLFDKLEPGTYTLMAEKAGYLQQAYGSRAGSFSGTALTLRAGQEMKDLVFKLVPQSILSGTVVDEDGEPAGQGIFVQVFAPAGSRRTTFGMGDSTNELGEFRIAGIAPGRYIVGANPQMRMFRGAEPASKSDQPPETPVPTFYPGVTDPGGASVLDVTAGQDIPGIQITLRKARAYRVEGKIAAQTTASARNLHVTLVPRDRKDRGMGPMASALVKADGTFTVDNVIPGSYTANAMSFGDGPPRMAGRASVDVTDAHVRGVVLTVRDPLEVNGTIRIDGTKAPSLDSLRVIIRSVDENMFGSRPVTVNADRTFKIREVNPDKYWVGLMGLDDTAYLKAVLLSGRDVLESGVDLTAAEGAAAVEIVLGTKPGTVEGTVRDDSKAVPGIGVTLAPDPAKNTLRMFQKHASTDQNGRFTIKGVAPGRYKLYAVADSSEMDLIFNPDSLKPYDDQAAKVTVEEGATAHADLTPLKLDEARGRAQ